ncbi:MAG: hypothetical protein HY048_04850 [Acidobacteria bacterium]|nr:hypothetical protein [Acidobacteriota bacterium]
MSETKRQTWVSIVIALVIIVAILAISAVGGTAYFISRHVRTQFTPETSAAEQFAQARARFVGQKPLIEIRRDDEPVLHRELATGSTSTAKLSSLRVLAYDTRAQKLVNISIPFWLLRLAPSNKFSVLGDNGIDLDSDRVHLTLEDIERRGPGLILDQADRRGSQVIVWTE